MESGKSKKISEKVYELLCNPDVPNKFIGKLIIDLNSGSVGVEAEIKVSLSGKVKI